jgi:hypothetical protein
MRTVTALAFDDMIVGTATTWYTADEFNDLLMRGDGFAVQACTKKVSGTSPTITVYAEHSENAEHWIAVPTAVINGAIAEGSSLGGYLDGFAPVLMSRLRLKISLGGSTPRCRLKLYVTMRVFSSDAPTNRPSTTAARPAQPSGPYQRRSGLKGAS